MCEGTASAKEPLSEGECGKRKSRVDGWFGDICINPSFYPFIEGLLLHNLSPGIYMCNKRSIVEKDPDVAICEIAR